MPDLTTPAGLRARIEAAGITQGEAARLLRVDERTVRRWLAGDVPIPAAAACLLDALLHLRAEDERKALSVLRAWMQRILHLH